MPLSFFKAPDNHVHFYVRYHSKGSFNFFHNFTNHGDALRFIPKPFCSIAVFHELYSLFNSLVPGTFTIQLTSIFNSPFSHHVSGITLQVRYLRVKLLKVHLQTIFWSIVHSVLENIHLSRP